MRKLLEIIIGVLIGLAASGVIWLAASPPRGQEVTLRPAPTAVPIVVQVKGSVPRPGVYELPPGSRVRDAVQAAGGFLAEAEKDKVNLASPLKDGQELVIPGPTQEAADSGEDGNGEYVDEEGEEPPDDESLDLWIDINYASAEELEALPGIGPTLAMRIVEYREQNGPFQAIEDIINVSGIGPATFEKFMNYIYVSE
jgi:competence protein ComEA